MATSRRARPRLRRSRRAGGGSKDMARKPTQARRKLVEFDAETWHGLELLARETMKSFQELADEAFRDLLQKYGRRAIVKHAGRSGAQRILISTVVLGAYNHARGRGARPSVDLSELR